jgi:hypothetical protein
MVQRIRIQTALLPKPPLLISESAEEFDAVYEALEREIRPRGIIEQMYLADISSIIWEILRLRRCKAVIVNAARRTALQNLLYRLLEVPGADSEEAEYLALAWFTDREAKKQVSEVLGQFGLDELAIEAEAIRCVSSDLELLDRMLASLESRRDKALRRVAEYRGSLARQLRESADRMIEGQVVPPLHLASSKESAQG